MSSRPSYRLLTLACALCASCTTPAEKPPAPLSTPSPVSASTEAPKEPAVHPPVHSPAISFAHTQAALRLNAFAFDWWGKMARPDRNLVLSPVSLGIALHMLREGARATSHAALDKVLHAGGSDGALLSELSRSFQTLASKDGHLFTTANRIFPRVDAVLVEDFASTMKGRYGSTVELLSFATDPEGSTRVINEWAKQETGGRIEALFDKPLEPDTFLVLANAVYFKALWASRFDPALTKAEPFLANGKTERQVPFMHQTGEFKTSGDDLVKVLELPYAGGAFALDIILPRSAKDLAKVERELTVARLAILIDELSAVAPLSIAVPRFSIAGAAEELEKPLTALGMGRLFGPQADLSGIAGLPGRLYVGHVVQRAFIEVNEQGSEAAAASAVTIRVRSRGPEPFEVRHPFLFVIREVKSGAILFMGHVIDPAG